MKVVLLFLLLLSLYSSIVYSLSGDSLLSTVYTSTLTGQQVPGGNGNTTRYGTAVCVISRNVFPLTIDCEVQHDIDSITSAFLGIGSRGVTGTILRNFISATKLNFRDEFLISNEQFGSTVYTPLDIQNFFLRGQMYIMINCEYNLPGCIRGQIEHGDRAFSRINPQNTIPQSSGTGASGIALATYSFHSPLRELAFDIVHDVTDVTSIEILEGAPNEVGDYIHDLDRKESPVFSEFQLTITENKKFLSDLTYINILSLQNPTGDIRGQLETIDYISGVSFTSRINEDGAIVNSGFGNNFIAQAFLIYNCDTRVLQYVIMHNIPSNSVSRVFFGIGLENVNGVEAFAYEGSLMTSPIVGSRRLTSVEEIRLYTDEMFIAITLVNGNPEGDIRGQINEDFNYYTYLSGTNVIPAVSTPGFGMATFAITNDYGFIEENNDDDLFNNIDVVNNVLDYEIIFFETEEIFSVELYGGAEGENGELLIEFDEFTSPITGRIVIDDDIIKAIQEGFIYVQISTLSHPFGEIRGSLHETNPCTERNVFQVPDLSTEYFSPTVFKGSTLTFSELKTTFTPGDGVSGLFPGIYTTFYDLYRSPDEGLAGLTPGVTSFIQGITSRIDIINSDYWTTNHDGFTSYFLGITTLNANSTFDNARSYFFSQYIDDDNSSSSSATTLQIISLLSLFIIGFFTIF
eukprot:TRINITY_DN14426_c0_g1_i1.p1 TRINITY_DN14426_c0_g1~~TRINITY_DN14426_c0_g1_i1.p1  ORF type:complete len:697 (+),score=224.99 TRINITY_DN14426_c0_g1_i1:30-2093(+)